MHRLAWAWLSASLALPATAPGEAQTDQALSVCDIAAHPERFEGKIVVVRGRINIAFEDFEMSSRACEQSKIDGVWLEYGRGPKRQPTTWCCGDMVPRDRLRLIDDADFRTFHHYLTAQTHRSGCYEGQCYKYTLTATITGRVDVAPLEICPNGKSQCCESAFGHFGASCVRLVIHQVSHVVADLR